MRQVATGGEIEPHEDVARSHEGHEGGGIGRSTRVRLDVCKFTSEKLSNPFNCQGFRYIYILATAVVAPSRQAFGVFVRENRSLRFENRFADDIFRGNELDLVGPESLEALQRLVECRELVTVDAANLGHSGHVLVVEGIDNIAHLAPFAGELDAH